MNNKVLAIAGLALLAVASPPLASSADAGYRGYRGYYGSYYRPYNAWGFYTPRVYRSYGYGNGYRAYNRGMPSWYNKRFHGWRVGANTS